MKHLFAAACAALCAAVASGDEILVMRIDSKVNAGFKERIYVDGRNVLTLDNGKTGKINITSGDHTIYAELSTLKTEPVSFSLRGAASFRVLANSLQNFVIEPADGITIREAPIAVVQAAPVKAAPVKAAKSASKKAPSGVEGSLEDAADKIMEKVPPKARVAIVYVTAADADVAEFVANELEFIMVDAGLTLIDRSQLDRIRAEQKLQMSGQVNDSQAVSVGKLAGASVIITGAVTGSGDLRRLRLRALDTQTAQVLAAASERF